MIYDIPIIFKDKTFHFCQEEDATFLIVVNVTDRARLQNIYLNMSKTVEIEIFYEFEKWVEKNTISFKRQVWKNYVYSNDKKKIVNNPYCNG